MVVLVQQALYAREQRDRLLVQQVLLQPWRLVQLLRLVQLQPQMLWRLIEVALRIMRSARDGLVTN